MRTFEHFPQEDRCKICGTNEDKEYILVPIYGTSEGNICRKIPVHVDCLKKIRYMEEAEVFYIKL